MLANRKRAVEENKKENVKKTDLLFEGNRFCEDNDYKIIPKQKFKRIVCWSSSKIDHFLLIEAPKE